MLETFVSYECRSTVVAWRESGFDEDDVGFEEVVI